VNDTLINKEKMSHCIKNVSWLYTLTVLRFNKVCCCFWIITLARMGQFHNWMYYPHESYFLSFK